MKRIKKIEIKVFAPGNESKTVKVYSAGNGRAFYPQTFDHLLGRICEEVDKAYPGEKYKLVPVGPASFNFVHQGKAEEVA
jgi:hypothetical protein